MVILGKNKYHKKLTVKPESCRIEKNVTNLTACIHFKFCLPRLYKPDIRSYPESVW